MVCEALTDDILSVLAAGESEICGLNIERKWISIAFWQAPCADNNLTSASVLPAAVFIGLNKYRTVNKSSEILSSLTQEENIEDAFQVFSDKKDCWLNILVQVKSVNNTAFIPQDADKRFKIPLVYHWLFVCVN